MDIKDLYTVESHGKGAEMQVKDMNGVLTDMYITVVGIDSKQFKSAFIEGRKASIDDYDGDAVTLAKSTIGWRGFTNGGEDLPFTEQSVEELYINAPYIKTQVDIFMARRSNFTKS